MRSLLLFIAALSLVAACTDRPRLDSDIADRAQMAAYPELVALGPLLAGIPSSNTQGNATFGTGNLASRAAALRTRANRLRDTVVDSTTRNRMRAAVARHSQ